MLDYTACTHDTSKQIASDIMVLMTSHQQHFHIATCKAWTSHNHSHAQATKNRNGVLKTGSSSHLIVCLYNTIRIKLITSTQLVNYWYPVWVYWDPAASRYLKLVSAHCWSKIKYFGKHCTWYIFNFCQRAMVCILYFFHDFQKFLSQFWRKKKL